jgi:hypothetical protein
MKMWLRWILLVLTIGGGFTGLVVTLQAMFQSGDVGLGSLIIFSAFVALYIFTVVSGLFFADNSKCTNPLIVALGLQIPWVSSPILAYGFNAGFRINAGLTDGKLSVSYRLGSDFMFSFFQGRTWGFTINFFALLILVLLLKYSRTPNIALAPTTK